MNLESRLTRLEKFTDPQPGQAWEYSPMERAVRLNYLLDRVRQGEPLKMGMKAATRLVNLFKDAAERKTCQNRP